MIIGTFPIGKFTHPERRHEIRENEMDFFFGGQTNLLWKLLAAAFREDLSSPQTIKKFLKLKQMGIGDLIISCRRKNGSAADTDLFDIEWNVDLLKKIDHRGIKTVYFTGKKVEDWFQKLFPETSHLKKISLISPSAQIFRSLPKREDYQLWRKKFPDEPSLTFLVNDYREKFQSLS